jgi:membrane protein
VLPRDNSLTARIDGFLWSNKLAERNWAGRTGIRCAQIVYSIARKFADGGFSLQAMSLVYTTLLALVPLLAVSFSVLKAFGVHNQIEPLLHELLYPLGAQGEEITRRVVEFVDNIKIGVLGSVGIAMLFYTVVSMLSKIENAINGIWQVASPRSLARRFSDYLSLILVGPVLVFLALGSASSALDSEIVRWLASAEPLGVLLAWLRRLGPYLLLCLAFAFLYGFMPNTRVRLTTALIGGLFTGVLWFTSGRVFAGFVANSSNYSTIYAGFTGVVLFIIWLYVSWLIVLVGAQVSFYWQHPRFLDPRIRLATLNGRRREALALEIITLIGRSHQADDDRYWTLEALEARHRGLPSEALSELLDELLQRRLIIASNETPQIYLPARALGKISVAEVILAARDDEGAKTGIPAVDEVMGHLDKAIADALEGRTAEDLSSDRS